jgi:hypothetical protein
MHNHAVQSRSHEFRATPGTVVIEHVAARPVAVRMDRCRVRSALSCGQIGATFVPDAYPGRLIAILQLCAVRLRGRNRQNRRTITGMSRYLWARQYA